MSNNRNWNNVGEQIRSSVTEALRTGDFSGLNDLVSETVNNALQEARFQSALEKERQKERVKRQHEDWQVHRDDLSHKEWSWQQRERERLEEEKERQQQWQRQQNERAMQERERREELKRQRERQQEEQRRQQAQWQRERRQNARTGNQAPQARMVPVKTKRVGSVSNVLFTVFGGIGLGVAGLGLLGVLLALFFGSFALGRLIAVLIMGAVFGGMIAYGAEQRKRLARADKYVQLCGQKMYGVIEELAKFTGKSVRYVRRDLKKMLDIGIFPEGHLDEKQTCFMLNDNLYQQYLQTEAAYRQSEDQQRREQEAANAPKSREEQMAEEQRARDSELNAMVAEGMEAIRRLKELNDNIPEESISERLFQLESLLNEIFDRVKEHPEQMHRMHKLMDYYLPTTVKLVEAYEEFDKVSAPGEDILSAKAEIEKTLGIINQAFQELLNALFQDAAMDATTDAQVLQSMLAREGLTKELEFVKKEN